MHMAHHWNPAHFGIRTKKCKFIFYYGCDTRGANRTPPGWELYDLEKDPHEVNNVYDRPEYKDVVGQLKKQLRELREEYKDTDEDFPQIKKIVDEFWDYDDRARGKAIRISHECAERMRSRRRPRRGGATRGDWIRAAIQEAPRGRGAHEEGQHLVEMTLGCVR